MAKEEKACRNSGVVQVSQDDRSWREDLEMFIQFRQYCTGACNDIFSTKSRLKDAADMLPRVNHSIGMIFVGVCI